LARGFDGVTGGNIPVAQGVIADVTPPEQRAKKVGLLGAAFGLGFIIGPFIGGKLSDPSIVIWFTAATPFWFAAMLSHECFPDTVSASRDARSRTKGPQNSVESLLAGHRSRVHLPGF